MYFFFSFRKFFLETCQKISLSRFRPWRFIVAHRS